MTARLSDEVKQSEAYQFFKPVLDENLKVIRENIEKACMNSGRSPEDITLLGVTKTVDALRINMAIEAGITHIGENRVQEYLGKREDLLLDGVDVHLIGHLQTNKVNSIINKVNMIESVDSLRVAQAIDAACCRLGCQTDVLVEVNIGNEETKSGISSEKTEELLCELSGLQHICVRGLMTVPPISDTDSQKRRYFSFMRKLFIDIKGKNIDNVHMDILSMGMSSDYMQAIQEGATLVRIGSALFGKRVYTE